MGPQLEWRHSLACVLYRMSHSDTKPLVVPTQIQLRSGAIAIAVACPSSGRTPNWNASRDARRSHACSPPFCVR